MRKAEAEDRKQKPVAERQKLKAESRKVEAGSRTSFAKALEVKRDRRWKPESIIHSSLFIVHSLMVDPNLLAESRWISGGHKVRALILE